MITPTPDCTVSVRLHLEDDFGLEIPPYVIVQVGRDHFTRTFPRMVTGKADTKECARRVGRLLGVEPIEAEATISV